VWAPLDERRAAPSHSKRHGTQTGIAIPTPESTSSGSRSEPWSPGGEWAMAIMAHPWPIHGPSMAVWSRGSLLRPRSPVCLFQHVARCMVATAAAMAISALGCCCAALQSRQFPPAPLHLCISAYRPFSLASALGSAPVLCALCLAPCASCLVPSRYAQLRHTPPVRQTPTTATISACRYSYPSSQASNRSPR
jgi:hypothetical protein